MISFRYIFSITAIFFLLGNQPAHAFMDKHDAQCHHSALGLNSIRSAFQKWENGRRHPEANRELIPKVLLEHYRNWQAYNKIPAHILNEKSAQAMIQTFRHWHNQWLIKGNQC